MRSSLLLLACAATGFLSQNAAAQNTAASQKPAAAPVPTGFTLAPGVTAVPTAFTEIGYDTNPDQTYRPNASAFSRSGLGIGLSSVSREMVARVNAVGSWVDYFSDPDRPTRLAGGAQANLTYLLRPGWTVTGTSFFSHDGQSFSQSESGGAAVETAYRDDVMMTFLRGRHTGIRYLNEADPSNAGAPLLKGSAFNTNRTEVTWGGIHGLNSRIGGYAEVSATKVDYPHRPAAPAVNRNADDFYVKAGMRLTLSPAFYTDLGWRWNSRNLADSNLRDYTSSFFDGAVYWRPSKYFFITASLQQMIRDASMDPAYLASVRSYEVKVTYLPVAGVAVSVGGVWQDVTEVGANNSYRNDIVNSTVSYDYSEHLQLYTNLRYEYFTEEWRNPEYDRFRVLAGVRIIPDGNRILPLEPGGSFKDFRPAGTLRLPSDATLTTSLGYSWFDLPDMKMVTRIGGPFWNEATGQLANADGSLGGMRLDARLEKFAQFPLPNGNMLSFALSGFYAYQEGTDKARCRYSSTQDCAIVNIADVSGGMENNTGPFGDLHIKTYRRADYYGMAVDVRFAGLAGGGWKDAPVPELSPFRFGLALRGLDQNTKLTSIDPLVCKPARYREWLDTQYYGGFVGLDKTFPVGETGWLFSVDGTAGLYFAQAQYLGHYSGYAPVYGYGYVEDNGTANDTAEHSAFIGTLRVGFNRDFGWASAGLYGQADYLSYAPRVVYNNRDYAGGAPWGVEGNNPATHISPDEAVNYSVGLSLKIKTD